MSLNDESISFGKSHMELPVINVFGSHYDMGLQYGKAAETMIRTNIDYYIKRFQAAKGFSEAVVIEKGKEFGKMIHEYNGKIGSMLNGVADAISLPRPLIYALNARTEIMYGYQHEDDGCTSATILPGGSKNGNILLGQNWDWHAALRDNSVLLHSMDDKEHEILTIAEAGMLAKTGMNSKGIGICTNLIVCDEVPKHLGIPHHVLLRGALESVNLDEALRSITSPYRSSSANFMLADAGGEAIDLEITPNNFGYLLPQDHLLIHSNHFLSSVGVNDVRKGISKLTLLRPERVRHILEDKKNARQVTVEDFQTAFRDHFSYPSGVCRHTLPGEDEDENSETLFSIIMDLSERVIFIAKGPPCEHDFIAFKLKCRRKLE